MHNKFVSSYATYIPRSNLFPFQKLQTNQNNKKEKSISRYLILSLSLSLSKNNIYFQDLIRIKDGV